MVTKHYDQMSIYFVYTLYTVEYVIEEILVGFKSLVVKLPKVSLALGSVNRVPYLSRIDIWTKELLSGGCPIYWGGCLTVSLA